MEGILIPGFDRTVRLFHRLISRISSYTLVLSIQYDRSIRTSLNVSLSPSDKASTTSRYETFQFNYFVLAITIVQIYYLNDDTVRLANFIRSSIFSTSSEQLYSVDRREYRFGKYVYI